MIHYNDPILSISGTNLLLNRICTTRQPMPSFVALTGYAEAIAETVHLADKKIELDKCEKCLNGHALTAVSNELIYGLGCVIYFSLRGRVWLCLSDIGWRGKENW